MCPAAPGAQGTALGPPSTPEPGDPAETGTARRRRHARQLGEVGHAVRGPRRLAGPGLGEPAGCRRSEGHSLGRRTRGRGRGDDAHTQDDNGRQASHGHPILSSPRDVGRTSARPHTARASSLDVPHPRIAIAPPSTPEPGDPAETGTHGRQRSDSRSGEGNLVRARIPLPVPQSARSSGRSGPPGRPDFGTHSARPVP